MGGNAVEGTEDRRRLGVRAPHAGRGTPGRRRPSMTAGGGKNERERERDGGERFSLSSSVGNRPTERGDIITRGVITCKLALSFSASLFLFFKKYYRYR